MATAAKYAHAGVDADPQQTVRVSAEAGRKCVRNIQQYPILSCEWIALTDSLKQLARLVHLETRMPARSDVSETRGRNMDSDGTLWDQEQNENAIRILVEEAKVNLCLRMLHEYKVWQYNDSERDATIAQAKQNMDYTDSQIESKCQLFEECLGLLLWRAFSHVETLQLMDIPLLIEHCAMVFSKSRTGPPPLTGSNCQEDIVLHYFSSLMKHAEALSNSELLARCKEVRLIHLAADHLLEPVTEITSFNTLSVCAEGFAALADNEDFSCDWQSFFDCEVDDTGNVTKTVEDVMDTFMLLNEAMLQPVLKEMPERRRLLRPLMDFFNKMRRVRGA